MSRPPVTALLGRRLHALRVLRKLTQEDLGERAGVSGKFVGQVERGVANPSLKVLDRLSQALAVNLPDLFRFEETRPTAPAGQAARAFAASEMVSDYLSRRPAADVE